MPPPSPPAQFKPGVTTAEKSVEVHKGTKVHFASLSLSSAKSFEDRFFKGYSFNPYQKPLFGCALPEEANKPPLNTVCRIKNTAKLQVLVILVTRNSERLMNLPVSQPTLPLGVDFTTKNLSKKRLFGSCGCQRSPRENKG